MSAGSRVALILALTLALLSGVALVGGSPGSEAPQVSVPETNSTTAFVVEVQPNGDARWTVSTTFNLTTDSEIEAFRSLAADFERGETAALGLDAYRTASQRASETTGRPMSITDVSRESSPDSVVRNGTGRLALSFTWTNFGRVDGDRIHLGDVYDTPSGTWLPGLEPDQTLVIRAPPQYSIFDANVPPDNGSLQWTGPETFGPDSLDATFAGGESDADSFSWLWILIATLSLAGGALAVYLVSRREDGLSFPPSPTSDGEETPPEAGSASETAATDESVEPAATAETTEDDESDDDTEIDLELLSDEERVEHLLEENGGRMKQANIVKETGWSNAKVSQLLSSMEDEGQIDKLRIGRENLISFPDEDVTDLED